MIKAFPKIFTIGTDYIAGIFDNEVEITEKIDGSQFVFGKIKGELFIRSKGQQLFADNPEKMFKDGVDYILAIQENIPDNTIFYCEYLNKPHHNVLNYGRAPKNNLILFGVADVTEKFDKFCEDYSGMLDIECVPVIYEGKIENPEQLLKMLERDSILGNTKIEGVVVKNYSKPFLLGGQPIPLMCGKYVSEKFKEVHRKSWSKEYTGKGRWQLFVESFRTEARWRKSIQHLKEKGELENSPRDIGKLLKSIQIDITEECKEDIKERLWKEFGNDILRKSIAGFPEWYKKELLENSFKKE